MAPTGGAEVNECLKAAALIKDNDAEGWVKEWASIAEAASQAAGQAMQLGQLDAGRRAFLRASNYYRSAMFLLPPSDARLDQYLTCSRQTFHQAAGLFSPQIEIVDIVMNPSPLIPTFLSTCGRGIRS